MERLFTADASRPAIIMALSGETITHGQLEARANRIAHLLRAAGLKRGDHCAVFMENHPRYIECGFGAERAGLYYTNVNSYLTPGELAYIVNNSLSQVLVTSQSHLAIAREALLECPHVKLCLVVDGPGDGDAVRNLDEATALLPDTPIPDESKGWAMLYSSGTTGQPKGILRPLADTPARQLTPIAAAFAKFWDVRRGEICLVPAPLYHSAPWAEATLTIVLDGMAVVMERFDPEAVLQGDREISRDPRPVRPDDVLAHAQAAAGRSRALRSLLAPVRSTRRGAVPDPDQAGDDRLARPDRPRVLQRH